MLSEDERGAIQADCSRLLGENWRQGTRRTDGVPKTTTPRYNFSCLIKQVRRYETDTDARLNYFMWPARWVNLPSRNS